jgi:glycerol-3-phosphate O-acyltransferase
MSDMGFSATLKKTLEAHEIPEKVYEICFQLYDSYANSLRASGFQMEEFDHLFETLLSLVKEQVVHPYRFEPYHQKIVHPFNYYQFGIEFIRPLTDKKRSHVHLLHNVEKMEKQLALGENVILFANHQTEVDPQLMSLVLEDTNPHMATEVIFVAGDRVLTDPMAIPFSMGRNLLCIYSKRHIDNPPEKKEEKLQHNQRTMQRMKELLSEGGKFIYVAPSGGRDRPDQNGEVVVAPFDPQSVEMFRLMAKQSKKPVHFYPLALMTFDILPPPHSIESELGEIRRAKREGALFSFGDEINMDAFPGSELADRHAKRGARALYIWNLVKTNYSLLKSGMKS